MKRIINLQTSIGKGANKMKRFGKVKQYVKLLSVTMISFLMIIGAAPNSYADWYYGIGTGLFGLNVDGNMGTHLPLAGSIVLKSELDADETSDLMESAFGFGGYATDGTWMIQYSYGSLELADSSSHSLPEIASTVSFALNFEVTSAELTVGYPVYKSPDATVHLEAGLRYIEHDITSTLAVTGGVNESITRNINEDWTDVLIGATINVPIVPKWNWITRANAGFGGSEGTYMGQTGVNWRFYKNWSCMLFAKYTAVEYDNGTKGSPGWYLYDVDEFGPGFNVVYNW